MTEHHPTDSIPQTRWSLPDGATEVILVRHGESEPYQPGIPFPLAGGSGDPALAPEGEAQAERVADALADEPLDAITVTSLRRTHQTAAPLAARLGIEPIEVADLKEVFLGEWEGGLFRQKVREGTDPAVVEFLASGGEWGSIPGAETSQQLEDRVLGALHRVASDHRDQLLVCVVHGGVIGALLSSATGSPPRVFGFAENGSFTRVTVTDDDIHLRSFNEVQHLR